MAATESPKKLDEPKTDTKADTKAEAKRPDSTSDPKPVGTAARVESDTTSLPLSGVAPLASESSDPAVQKLLADKQAHQMNRDLIDPPVTDKEALKVIDAQIAEVDAKLSVLGFEQQSQAERKAAIERAADAEAKQAEEVEKKVAAAVKAAEDDYK